MWAIARYDLRISEAEVWWLTPRQFVALAERHRMTERRRDLRFGAVAATIANVNRDPKKRSEAFSPLDFFPEPGQGDEDDLPELTMEALRAEFEAAGATVRSRREETDG